MNSTQSTVGRGRKLLLLIVVVTVGAYLTAIPSSLFACFPLSSFPCSLCSAVRYLSVALQVGELPFSGRQTCEQSFFLFLPPWLFPTSSIWMLFYEDVMPGAVAAILQP